MVELHLRRALTGAVTRKASLEVICAIQTVLAFTHEQDWSVHGDR